MSDAARPEPAAAVSAGPAGVSSVAATDAQGVHIEDVLASDGLFVSTTVGISMWPLLRNRRDTIVVAAVPEDRRGALDVGDVALYRAGGRYVLHRVVGFWPDGAYRIRGDNTVAAEHVEPAQVIGVLAEIYRRRGRMSGLGAGIARAVSHGPAASADRALHIDCATSRGYRRYWRCWLAIWPVRRVAKALRFAAGRAAHAVLAPFGWKGLHPNGY